MTKEQIAAVLQNVGSWPQEDQEELVELAREIEARRKGIYELDEGERRGIHKGLEAMRQGRFADEERIAALLKEARSLRK